jgi:cobalt/nickel transport system permease protein
MAGGHFSLADVLQVERAQFLRRATGLRLWDPRVKLGLAVIALAVNVLLPSKGLSLGILAAALVGMAWTRVPFGQAAFFFLAPAWATLVVMAGYAFTFGPTPVWAWWKLTLYREGLALGAAAGLRVMSEMACVGLLVLSTPFYEVLEALRWFRLPAVLVDTLAFMYRYVFLLFDEYSAMRASAKVRGGYAGYRLGLKTTGQIAAQIFLRAYDRAERISQAMRARGGEA